MKDKKTKTTTIAFRIEQDLKAQLQKAALKDRRSLSQYVEIVLINHLNILEEKAKVQGGI
jgi:predicted HicB family RNase H-like nuclease